MESTQVREADRTETPEVDPHQEARDYDRDRLKWQEDRAKIWRGIAVTAVVLLLIAIVVDVFRPQPVVEVPYVVRVDTTTGVVDTVTRITDGTITYEEAVNNYFLEQYIQCRETYHRFTYKMDYEKCAMFTPEEKRDELLELFDYQRPGSYYKRYGEAGKVEALSTYIKPTSEKGKSEVHFILTETIGDATTRSTWVSTIKFAFDRSKLVGAAARKVNPLGFQVLAYRRDAEIVKTEVPK